MDEKVKKALEALNKAFDDFKAANNKRLQQIEARGSADPHLDEQVNKLNAEIDKLRNELTETQAQAQERMDQLETQSSRPTGGPGGDAQDEAEQARQFFSLVSGRDQESGDLEAYRAYHPAFISYLRRGDRGLTPEVQASLSVGSDPSGGFWVTPDTGGRLVELIHETSPMRQVAGVVSIGTDALEGPYDLGEASTGWVGEKEARPETNTPTVGGWRIEVHEQYAQPKVTQKLLDDASFPVESWLQGKVAIKLARTENTAFIAGNGEKKPRGFLTYPVSASAPTAAAYEALQFVASGKAGTFADASPGDALISLIYALKAAYRQGAIFMMTRATLAEVRKLKDGQGNYLWQPDFSQKQGGNLVGFPVTEAEDMPDLAANSLSIAFGDFSQGYQIVDRIGIRVLRDPLTEKGYVKFYTTKRVGGGMVDFDAIKVMKFAA